MTQHEQYRVFIYCDAPSHPGRRVAVTNFRRLPDGGWHEEPASRAPESGVGTGAHIIGDDLAARGWTHDPNVSNADVRSWFELKCRKCRHRGVNASARLGTLYAVLDAWRTHGMSESSLSFLAASLSRQAETSRETPESGQG